MNYIRTNLQLLEQFQVECSLGIHIILGLEKLLIIFVGTW